MERRTKLGLAATSLAAAGTLIAPATVSANDPPVIVCDIKLGCGADPFVKIDDFFVRIGDIVEPAVFEKIEWVYEELQGVFFKIEV